MVSSLRRSARHRRAVIRSPRAAYQRGPSSRRKAGVPMALADDAADRPRGQVKHGSGPAFGAGPTAPGQPCQVCEQAGVVQQGDPGPRRRTGTIRCPVRPDASSEGTANRLDRVRNDGRTSGNRTAHAGRQRNPGSIRPLWKHRRARVHRVRRGRPSSSPRAPGSHDRRPRRRHDDLTRPGPTSAALQGARSSDLAFSFFALGTASGRTLAVVGRQRLERSLAGTLAVVGR